MYFCSLSSGSSGNCLYIETSESKFLIDAGHSGVQIKRLMESRGLDPRSLDFILLTHEHSDHSKGVGVMSRRYDLPILSNESTFLSSQSKIGQIKDKNLKFFNTEEDFEYRDLGLMPLRIHHDASDPVGYIIYAENKKISILTDTGFVTRHMVEQLAGSDMYFIESNFDPNMLANSSYPESLRRRIDGNHGHLSNEEAADLISQILKTGNEKVYLGHLSEENNLPIIALNTVQTYLESKGLDKLEQNIEVAKRYSPNEIHEV